MDNKQIAHNLYSVMRQHIGSGNAVKSTDLVKSVFEVDPVKLTPEIKYRIWGQLHATIRRFKKHDIYIAHVIEDQKHLFFIPSDNVDFKVVKKYHAHKKALIDIDTKRCLKFVKSKGALNMQHHKRLQIVNGKK
jgi:hypothetical protein